MMSDPFEGCVPVALEEVLEAREERAFLQKELLRLYGGTLVCLTLVMPGQYKQFPLGIKAFEEGEQAVLRQFLRHGIPVKHRRRNERNTGSEGFFSVDAPAREVKERMTELEEGHGLGRLLDLDVMDSSGAISRENLGKGGRRCLACGGPVWSCARSRAHPPEELQRAVLGQLNRYFAGQYAEHVASCAVRALLSEVSVTPKPGLVDQANCGAHRDMDFFNFVDSACALFPYFRDCAAAGLSFEGPPELLPGALRYRGQEAEREMLQASGGVNTHKGAVFSLGLICAGAGFLSGKEREWGSRELLEVCGEMAAGLEREQRVTREITHGDLVRTRYGLSGAQGEAVRGFPHVRDHGLCALRKHLARGESLNDAGVVALLHLMARVEDTNVVHRGGMKALERIRRNVGAFLSAEPDGEEIMAFAQRLDRELIKENISPGGSADLLAVVLFLHFLLEEREAGGHSPVESHRPGGPVGS